MYTVATVTLLDTCLVIVALVAGLRILAACLLGLVRVDSPSQTLLGVLVFSILVLVAIKVVAPSPRLRAAAMFTAVGALVVTACSGAAALARFVLARIDAMPVHEALAVGESNLRLAGVGICVAAISWGMACTANIFAPNAERSK